MISPGAVRGFFHRVSPFLQPHRRLSIVLAA
jgi:hypothetical protein